MQNRGRHKEKGLTQRRQDAKGLKVSFGFFCGFAALREKKMRDWEERE